MLISAGPHSSTSQVRFYSQDQLKAVLSNSRCRLVVLFLPCCWHSFVSCKLLAFISLLDWSIFFLCHPATPYYFQACLQIIFTNLTILVEVLQDSTACICICSSMKRQCTSSFCSERIFVILVKECWRAPGKFIKMLCWPGARLAQGRATPVDRVQTVPIVCHP